MLSLFAAAILFVPSPALAASDPIRSTNEKAIFSPAQIAEATQDAHSKQVRLAAIDDLIARNRRMVLQGKKMTLLWGPILLGMGVGIAASTGEECYNSPSLNACSGSEKLRYHAGVLIGGVGSGTLMGFGVLRWISGSSGLRRMEAEKRDLLSVGATERQTIALTRERDGISASYRISW